MKGQLKQASRLHARYVAIVDDTGQVRLKDMDAAEQQEIADTDVVAQVLRGRGLR
jgi:histidyl-tRNA synthetase